MAELNDTGSGGEDRLRVGGDGVPPRGVDGMGGASGGRAEIEQAELGIAVRQDPSGDPIVVLAGELDISTAGSLEKIVVSVVSGSPTRLIFDLSELRFVDSAGIAVLVGAAKKVQTINLRNPSSIVARVIELTGLEGVLPTES
jgi:anti-sigma B factor antagonist